MWEEEGEGEILQTHSVLFHEGVSKAHMWPYLLATYPMCVLYVGVVCG